MKKISLISIFILVLSLVVIGNADILSAEETYNFSIQHLKPIGAVVDQEIRWLEEQLHERTNGRIEFTIHPNAELGDYSVVQSRVALGDVDMQIGPLGQIEDHREQIGYLPYMITEFEDIPRAYSFRGAEEPSIIVELLDEVLAEQNLKLLASWPAYFGAIGLTERPENPGNIERHGIDIRSPEIVQFELVAQLLGYNPTAIAYADAYTAIESGTVDGIIGAGSEAHYELFGDILDYQVQTNSHLESHWWYINMDSWNNLSEEDQEIFLEVAEEFERRRLGMLEEEEHEYRDRLREDYGVEIIDIGEEARTRFAREVRENLWPEIVSRGILSEEIMNAIREEFPLE